MSSLISIIVPIYNVEKYLNRCIKSIVNQTYRNLEIILVDDGSPDSCAQICDEWSNKDNRIKVVHKENGGLSDARNAGMQIATGEYIGFVDSDDWIHPQMYEILYKVLVDTGCDISTCKFQKREEVNNKDFKNIEIVEDLKFFSTEQALKELILDGQIQQVVWNKLYKREIINDILFEYGKYNEDEFWSYQIIANAACVVVVDFIGYFYFQRSNSIIGENYSLKRLDGLEGKEKRLKFVNQYFPALRNAATLDLYYSLCYAYQCCLRSMDKDNFAIAKKRIKQILKECPVNIEIWKKEGVNQKIWIVLYKISIYWTCRLRNRLKIGL